MKKLFLVLLLFCSPCATTKIAEKCSEGKEKKECCSKK